MVNGLFARTKQLIEGTYENSQILFMMDCIGRCQLSRAHMSTERLKEKAQGSWVCTRSAAYMLCLLAWYSDQTANSGSRCISDS